MPEEYIGDIKFDYRVLEHAQTFLLLPSTEFMRFESLFRSKLYAAPLTASACAYCVLVFLALNLSGDKSYAFSEHWGYFPDRAIWEGQPWALLTSVFVHLEIWHIAFNLYWLWILGGILEESIGSLRFALFFVGAAWVSSAGELLLGGDLGIGMSGVGYALFGFGWVARRKMAGFKAILNDQTVNVFLVWLVFCIVLTKFGVMQVANWAHLFGLLFGASVGGLFVLKWRQWLCAVGLMVLLGGSVVPLKWCPLSPEWTSLQAMAARSSSNEKQAIYWYRRTISLGGDKSWAWANLAIIYALRGDKAEYAAALRELRDVDSKSADEIEADYGKPSS